MTRFHHQPLYYYQPWLTAQKKDVGLLTNQDGNCTAWAELFIDTLKRRACTPTFRPVRAQL